AGKLGDNLFEKLQSFPAYLLGEGCQSSNVPTGSCKAGDNPSTNRIVILRHDNGNRRSCFLGGTGCCRTTRDAYLYLETHQFSCKASYPISFLLCNSPLNHNVVPLHVPKLAKTLPQGLPAAWSGRREGRS